MLLALTLTCAEALAAPRAPTPQQQSEDAGLQADKTELPETQRMGDALRQIVEDYTCLQVMMRHYFWGRRLQEAGSRSVVPVWVLKEQRAAEAKALLLPAETPCERILGNLLSEYDQEGVRMAWQDLQSQLREALELAEQLKKTHWKDDRSGALSFDRLRLTLQSAPNKLWRTVTIQFADPSSSSGTRREKLLRNHTGPLDRLKVECQRWLKANVQVPSRPDPDPSHRR